MNKKVIIFDMDGVLFDTVELMQQSTLMRYPDLSADTLRNLNKGNFFEEIEKLAHLKKEETEEEKIYRREKYTKDKLNAPMYAGIKELLYGISKKYVLAVNTSASMGNSLPLFEKEEITSLFSFLGTKDVHASKVEKFKIIGEKFDQKPEDMLFITDTIGDIREAEIAGIPTIAVTWGIHNREYFEKETFKVMIAIIDTPEHLEEYIQDF